MKLSLLYTYDLKDKYFIPLIEFVKKNKEIELIILDQNNKKDLKVSNNYPINITRLNYPRVSKGFLYNRGILQSKSNIVCLIQNAQQFIDNYKSKTIDSLFEKNQKLFLVSTSEIGCLKNTKTSFFPKKKLFDKFLNIYFGNFYLDKRKIINQGLFFDEKLDVLSIIDMALRAKRINFFCKDIAAKDKKRLNIKIKSLFFLGKDLNHLFKKYKKNRHILIYLLFNDLYKSPIRVFMLIFGVAYSFITQNIFFKLKFFLSKRNRAWIEFCRRKRLSRLLLPPAELAIEPTNYCNAHCPLCPTGTKQLKRAKGFMEFSLFKKIIDQNKFFVDTILLWNMGEPFLHPEIYSMIQYAKRFGIRVISSTNGYTFYSNSQLNQLVESGLDELTLSIDGIDKKTSSRYRKGIDFLKVINGLKYLQIIKKTFHSINPIVYYQVILTKFTENQIKDVKSFSKKLGTKMMIKRLNLEMVNKNNKKNYLPTKIKARIYENEKQSRIKNNPCVCWDGVLINWDGLVNPCLFDYHGSIDLGNISKDSLYKIWKGEKMKNLRCQILKDRSKVKICNSCPINERYSELYISNI